MNKFVVRLTFVCVLAGLLVVPALAKQETYQVSPAQRIELSIPNAVHGQIAAEPVRLADGPDPVPWPKTGKPAGPKAVSSPKLLADGPDPVPWPKTGKPGGVL